LGYKTSKSESKQLDPTQKENSPFWNKIYVCLFNSENIVSPDDKSHFVPEVYDF